MSRGSVLVPACSRLLSGTTHENKGVGKCSQRFERLQNLSNGPTRARSSDTIRRHSSAMSPNTQPFFEVAGTAEVILRLHHGPRTLAMDLVNTGNCAAAEAWHCDDDSVNRPAVQVFEKPRGIGALRGDRRFAQACLSCHSLSRSRCASLWSDSKSRPSLSS